MWSLHRHVSAGEFWHQELAYNYGLDILLAGVDTEAHIYTIRNPGQIDCFDALGYNAIGSGELHAMSTFISSGCSPIMSTNRTAYLVFEAKRKAEVAPGVGRELDMAVVTTKKVHILDEEQIGALDAVYQERAQPHADATDERIDALPFGDLK